MAQQTIGVGTTANDGTGDPLRTAFIKSNANFTELYTNKITVQSTDVTYYVSTTGSDSNDGLTVGAPFLTIQKAADTVSALFMASATTTATIQLADGTYSQSSFLSLRAAQGVAANLYIKGNAASPGNVIIQTAGSLAQLIYVTQNANGFWNLQDFTLQSSHGATLLRAAYGANVQISNIVFGTTTGHHMLANVGGSILSYGNYSITGGAASHVNSDGPGSVISIIGRTVTITGTPAITNFAVAGFLSLTRMTSCTFNGGATGTRYYANANSVIDSGSAGATYFPGNVGGGTAAGGQYI